MLSMTQRSEEFQRHTMHCNATRYDEMRPDGTRGMPESTASLYERRLSKFSCSFPLNNAVYGARNDGTLDTTLCRQSRNIRACMLVRNFPLDLMVYMMHIAYIYSVSQFVLGRFWS